VFNEATDTYAGVLADTESNPGDTIKSFIAPRLKVGRGRRVRRKGGKE